MDKVIYIRWGQNMYFETVKEWVRSAKREQPL